MERRTTIGVAAGVTLTLAAVTVAIGLNVAIMSDRTPTTGPGTFERTADVVRMPANQATSTTAAAPTASGASSEATSAPAATSAPRADDDGDDRVDDVDHDSGHDAGDDRDVDHERDGDDD